METKPLLHIVPPVDYDTRPIRRPSWFAMFAADCRDVVSEVRGSPYSHALVALLTVIAWTTLLVVPTLIGGAK